MNKTPTVLTHQSGVGHYIALIAIVVLVGIAGVYSLVASQAASITNKTKNTSNYYMFSDGGVYDYVKVSSSGFSGAQCDTKKLVGKSATVKMPKQGSNGKHPALRLVCKTPPTSKDSYSFQFLEQKSGTADALNVPVLANQTADSCVFVHGANAQNAKGITRTLAKSNDGSCDSAAANDSEDKKVKPALKVDNLTLPDNFSDKRKDKFGYFLLPASKSNKDYYIHTKTMPGHESTTSTPASKRYGTKTMIAFFNTVALEYHDKYQDSKLVAGDINAKGHTTHRNGVDMDVYTSDRSAALTSQRGGSDSRSIELGKMMLDTRKVKFILFNDPNVISAVNAYAAQKNLPGRMLVSNETHDFHFHVRVNSEMGPCVYGDVGACSYARTIFSNQL